MPVLFRTRGNTPGGGSGLRLQVGGDHLGQHRKRQHEVPGAWWEADHFVGTLEDGLDGLDSGRRGVT